MRNAIEWNHLKVAEHSFLVPLRYSTLIFSNHWRLGRQIWQDASLTKKGYILICLIGLKTVAMTTRLIINHNLGQIRWDTSEQMRTLNLKTAYHDKSASLSPLSMLLCHQCSPDETSVLPNNIE